MSVARPAARRLLSGRLAALPGLAAAAAGGCTTAAAAAAAPSPSKPKSSPSCGHRIFAHQFHSSPQLSARRRPRFASVRAADMGLMDEKQIEQFTKEKFPKYTAEEMEQLSKRYSPEQMAAIEAGEAAVDPRDLTVQGRLRTDPYTMPYIDDFAESQPVIDKRPQIHDPPDPLARFMDMDEFTEDLIRWADQFPQGELTGKLKTLADFVPEKYRAIPEPEWPGEVRDEAHKEFQKYIEAEANRQADKRAAGEDADGGPTDADVLQYILERSGMTDNNLVSNSSLAHGLPSKVPGVAGRYKNTVDPEDEGLDDAGLYQELKQRTGFSVRQILNLKTKRLVTRMVSNQTRLGKIRKFSVIYVAGNGDGWLGIGEAKSTESTVAVMKARQLAIRNMRPIRRYENRTIYGTVEAKVSGTIVKMAARPPGFGLRVSHRIFEMCRCAGIHDLAATIPRSRNPMNSVKAAFKALCNQPDPEKIAIGRGRKLVDVRKVYYGGAVY
ncbi:a76d8f25-5fc5-4141-a590-1ad94b527f5e [Thermothielavioides terrestris]|uniref:Small ribosomal subunit protein uS5m n=1 Tax=Thermothielavioides terrestris TaxID=2587410 RepID=A0A446BYN1_9PEZI|nr:a76d8f25-5fc5-4141-a590-1ad94b527f5e [Thermothielavioides terrestris]